MKSIRSAPQSVNRRVLLGRRAAGDRACPKRVSSRRRSPVFASRRLDRSCARAGGKQPHNPARNRNTSDRKPRKASANRRTRLSLGGLDCPRSPAPWRRRPSPGSLRSWARDHRLLGDAPDHARSAGQRLHPRFSIAVRIGFEHGWSHIYSVVLQHQLFTELRPGVFLQRRPALHRAPRRSRGWNRPADSAGRRGRLSTHGHCFRWSRSWPPGG